MQEQVRLNSRLMEVISNLKDRGKGEFTDIINKLESSNPPDYPPERSFIFEALFANVLINNGTFPDYEVNVNEIENDTSVDFVYIEEDKMMCFELLSPEESDELKQEIESTKKSINGITLLETRLTSNNENPYLRPEAQTIRMQEKLLEKISKFPDPFDNIFSIIVVDCANFQVGMFDADDCRMVMYGRTQEPFNQQYWEKKPIKGLLEDAYNKRGTKEFRARITAVIFIPEFPSDPLNLLDNAFIVPNIRRSKNHLETFEQKLKRQLVFQKLKPIHSAPCK